MAGHHPPDEAGEFTGNSSSGDIVGTTVGNFPEFAFEAFISFVGIGNDCGIVSFLSCFQGLFSG